MAHFAIPQDENAELAGSVAELVDTLVAIKPLARETISIRTEYGEKTPALRVRMVNLDTGEDAGTRLLFWGTAQRQVLESTTSAEWAVGRFEMRPQVNDPTRTVYLFVPPDMSTIDPEHISNTIDNAVNVF